MFRLDQAGENFTRVVIQFCAAEGILLQPSPPYAPESNGTAERIVQEHWTRARVLLFASQLPNELWGEALKHANWLRNRLPASRINGELPILLWNPRTIIDFKSLLLFGQLGASFIYRSKTVAKKKLQPRSALSNFVGMESDARLIRVYIPTEKNIKVIRRVDFRPISEKLPGVSALLDGLAREHSIEVEQEEGDELHNAEAHLSRCMTALLQENPDFALP